MRPSCIQLHVPEMAEKKAKIRVMNEIPRTLSVDSFHCNATKKLIIKITISSLVIGLKMSYFPLIRLPSCYRTVCYWTVCYRTV